MTNNTTTQEYHMYIPSKAESVVLVFSCVVAASANIFVMVLIFAIHRLKSTTNLFVFSLCLCNSIISLILIPMRTFIVKEDMKQIKAYKYIVIITILIYISNLTAVSRHRLNCITEPMTYIQNQSKRHVLKIVAISWIAPFCYSLLPLIWFSMEGMSSSEALVHDVYKLVTLLLLLLPLVYIVYVFVKVYGLAKNIRKHQQVASSVPLPDQQNTQEIKLDELRVRSRSSKYFGVKFHCLSTKEGSDQDMDLSEENLEPGKGVPEVDLITPSPEFEVKHITGKVDSIVSDKDINTPNGSWRPRGKHWSSLCSMSTFNHCGSDSRCSDKSSEAKCTDDNVSHSPYSFPSPGQIGDLVRHVRTVSFAGIASFQYVMRRKAYEIKASLAFFIVTVLYMVTWVPVAALTAIDVIDSDLHIPHIIELLSLYTITFNALVDPFLYGLLLPSFRKTFKLALLRRRDKQSMSK